ncbi:hypothetical protein DAI22_08g171600 [Oryza sativa Japonica Group]|nr:hypothetical protein DAI22_08g171600 [Oryza sativa Japonica Group]
MRQQIMRLLVVKKNDSLLSPSLLANRPNALLGRRTGAARRGLGFCAAAARPAPPCDADLTSNGGARRIPAPTAARRRPCSSRPAAARPAPRLPSPFWLRPASTADCQFEGSTRTG